MRGIVKRLRKLEDHFTPAEASQVPYLRVISLADGRVIDRIPMTGHEALGHASVYLQ
jgi:hypothetical protein